MLRIFLRSNLILLIIIFFISACAPQAAPTLFRPPTLIAPTQMLATLTPIPAIYTPAPTPTNTITTAITEPCTSNLEFVDDITIKDFTLVLPGVNIDKQWLVKNSGTCNWNSSYHLVWIGGDPMGVEQEQVLYPARAGTQATLQILFIAPAFEGTYESAWQAYDPEGTAFGDTIFMKIIVSP